MDKTWTEAELRALIKDTMKQELKDLKSSVEDIKTAQKKKPNEEEVKAIVRETIVNMYKFFWQKSSMYIKQI